MPDDKVMIFDTTLRDGEQSAGIGLTTPEKLEIAKQLDRLGVDIIEAGFAASSPGDFEAVRNIASEVRRPIIASLARCHIPDVDAAWGAIEHAERPRIHVFISSSDVQIMHQLRRNPEQVLEMAVASVERAKQYCDDVEFSPMDATRTDIEYLYSMLEAVIDAGANTVNIADTVGYTIPAEFYERISLIRENVPNIDRAVMSVHCHNDLGMSVANSLAAVLAGARQVEGCINGLGERAGNAALEEIIMAIETRPDLFDVSTNIDTRQIYRTSRLVSDITGFPVQPNKAIVGANAFRHASGIHQDGVLKERSTFEIMDPRSVGWPSNELVLGKLSGRAGLRARLEELGYSLEQAELDEAFEAFKSLADKKREGQRRGPSIAYGQPPTGRGRSSGVQARARPVLVRQPRNPDRHRQRRRPGRKPDDRRRNRDRPGRCRVQGDQPDHPRGQHPDRVQGRRRHGGHRRHRRRDNKGRGRRRHLHRTRVGYRHHRRQRQGVHERAQPPDRRGQRTQRRRRPFAVRSVSSGWRSGDQWEHKPLIASRYS